MESTDHKARLIAWLLTAAMPLVLLSAQALASDSEYDSTGATYFTFTDGAITAVDGEYTDYKIDGTTLNIRGAGTYVVSGACSDGSISIRKGVTGVGSVMNGLTLSNTGSETTATAPVVCGKSTGVDNVVASGTTNTLTDSIYDNDDNYPENENAESAVIKCKDGSQVMVTGGTLLAAGGSSGMGMRLSASQPYVTFGSGGSMFGGQGSGRPWGTPPAMPFGGQPDWQQFTPPTGAPG